MTPPASDEELRQRIDRLTEQVEALQAENRQLSVTNEALVAAAEGRSDQARLEREELERQRRVLEAVGENAEAGLVYLDPQFNFVWVNSTYARGAMRDKAEFAGHNHFEFYPHEENEAIFARVRDTGQPAVFKAKPFEFPDHPELGVTYWDWTLAPVKDGAGAVEGLVLALVDVTERIRAEAALREREELLERYRLRPRIPARSSCSWQRTAGSSRPIARRW